MRDIGCRYFDIKLMLFLVYKFLLDRLMNKSGIVFGVTILLMHLCICHTQAEGGKFSIGMSGSRSDPMYEQEIQFVKTGLASYNLREAYPDEGQAWQKLIAKDIAANMGTLLEAIDQDTLPIWKKRALVGSNDRSVPRPILCSDNDELMTNSTGDCTDHGITLDFLEISDDEDDGLSVVSTDSFRGRLLPHESDELHLAITLSAAAYISDDEISGIPELVGNQVDEFPLGCRYSSRTVGGVEPTFFRVWKFKDNESTVYVSFMGIVDKAVHFSDLDTQMAPLSQSMFLPSSPSKRRYGQVSTSKVHKAFLYQYLMIEEQLRESLELSTNDNDVDRIVFTGHSIGGALAMIAGTVTRHLYPHMQIDVITFGSPRVGDSVFVEEYSTSVSLSLRVVLQGDDIPSVYPIKSTFQHVPGFFCVDCDAVETADISSVSRIQTAFNVVGKNELRRHSVTDYLRSIGARSYSSFAD